MGGLSDETKISGFNLLQGQIIGVLFVIFPNFISRFMFLFSYQTFIIMLTTKMFSMLSYLHIKLSVSSEENLR